MDKAVFMKNMRKKLLELVEGCAPPNRRSCAKLADRQGRPGPSATRPICRILSQLTYSSSNQVEGTADCPQGELQDHVERG